MVCLLVICTTVCDRSQVENMVLHGEYLQLGIVYFYPMNCEGDGGGGGIYDLYAKFLKKNA